MPDPWNLNKLIENVPAMIKAHGGNGCRLIRELQLLISKWIMKLPSSLKIVQDLAIGYPHTSPFSKLLLAGCHSGIQEGDLGSPAALDITMPS
jgi:hypothetical protein